MWGGSGVGSRRGQSGHRRPRPGSGHAHVSGHSARRGEGRPAVCGVGGVSDSGDQPAAAPGRGGARTLGETHWRCGGLGAREVRVGRARQGRRCLAAAGLTIAPLPSTTSADTRPTGMFLSYLDGLVGTNPVWAAVQRRGLCRPPCPALLYGRTSRSRWHGGHDIWADAPRVRRAGWPWGGRSCRCGQLAGEHARPSPADPSQERRHAVRAPPRHGSWPSCTPNSLDDGSRGRCRGWEMAIQVSKNCRAGAGMVAAGWRGRRACWRGQAGAHCWAWRLGGSPARALTSMAARPCIGRHQQSQHPESGRRIRNTSTVPACIAAQAGTRTGPAPRLAAEIGPGPWAGMRAAGLVGNAGAGWHWVEAFCGILWHVGVQSGDVLAL